MFQFLSKIQSNINVILVEVFVCGSTITATKTSLPSVQIQAAGNFFLSDMLVNEEDFMLTMAATLEELCSGEVQKKSPHITIKTRKKISAETKLQISRCLFRTGIGILKFANSEDGTDILWESPAILKLDA